MAYAYGETSDYVYVPVLESGLSWSVGALFLTPTSDFESYGAIPTDAGYDVLNVSPTYQFGIDASLGYIFDETANSVDLFFRNLSTSDDDTTTFDAVNVTGNLGYDLTAFDLMASQYINLGRAMQLRLMAGLAYVELKQNRNSNAGAQLEEASLSSQDSKYTGWGPRVGIDSRYEFFGGFGLVGGGSMAYYLGELTSNTTILDEPDTTTANDTVDNHGVMNIRANLGLDFVLETEDEGESSFWGLELGYLIDYYDDGVASTNLLGIESIGTAGEALSTSAVSFSGPYINLKGVF
jgi:hypothetical protein